MRFLLNIRTTLPAEWTPEQRDEFIHRETEAALGLMRAKVLRRVFRIVGRFANFSIWDVPTPEELHAVLQTLPMYQFMSITVTPIITHPVEQAYAERYGEIPPF